MLQATSSGNNSPPTCFARHELAAPGRWPKIDWPQIQTQLFVDIMERETRDLKAATNEIRGYYRKDGPS